MTPYDVWRLAGFLGCSTGDVLDRTMLVFSEEAGGQPLLQLALDGKTGECLHLNPVDRRCLVHAARPLSCRAFPLGIRHGEGGDLLTKALTLPECRGEGRGRGTAAEYLRANLEPGELAWSREYARLARTVFPAGDRRAGDREYVAYYLSTLFDLDRLPGATFTASFSEAERRLRNIAASY